MNDATLAAQLEEEIGAAEREAEQAIAAATQPQLVDALPARKRGRPPKHQCERCGTPLAKRAVCSCASAEPGQAFQNATAPVVVAPERPAWEPTALEDLRARLEMLDKACVEVYEDGPLKLKFDQEARRLRYESNEKNTTRW